MKKIFIADDDNDILEILTLMLKTHGFKVENSTNANDVFNYTNNFPDLILLDVWMSGIDGREICKRLKEHANTNTIPVVFISANTNIKEITEEYKAQGYIAKPFEMVDLIGKIKEILSTSNVI